MYSDDGEKVTCQDAGGNSISEDEYKNIADQHFDEFEKYQAKVQWIEDIHLADISKDEMFTMIENSYNAFIIE